MISISPQAEMIAACLNFIRDALNERNTGRATGMLHRLFEVYTESDVDTVAATLEALVPANPQWDVGFVETIAFLVIHDRVEQVDNIIARRKNLSAGASQAYNRYIQGWILQIRGDHEAALKVFEPLYADASEAQELGSILISSLACAYYATDRSDQGDAVLASIDETHLSNYNRACAAGIRGDAVAAVGALRMVFYKDDTPCWVARWRIDPDLSFIRTNSEFIALCKEITRFQAAPFAPYRR